MDDAALPRDRRAIDNVTLTVLHNLEDQHDWTELEVRDDPDQPRPLIRGLPPKRLYLHPDDQVEALAHERSTGEKLFQDPEHEWVLAVQLVEKWSLASFAAVFDSIHHEAGTRAKRIVLATLHNDSTVVYYLMHEGMVKPRQN
ncbi:putative tRNA-splicing endonuclease subunit tsp-1 [Tolypocladium ophioglossoides CBS 100239]|uniref:Putative tRNA-splicing endonuclease subunit tsp-1 n=1 Tax=Tolypocladium ophioglossoides (strain CBS 100239) TaxID=1163406 RepID=A0A0L0NFL2_TOLOC|nr:putative tRNA-splicing endonuclease subunit tsp-1 [Tolypocladium ophioglossoides CBS 100239]